MENVSAITVEEIAHQLLSDKSIGSFSHDICVVNECDFEDDIDVILYRFEMLQDISMEILHQYLFLISLMKNEENFDSTIYIDNDNDNLKMPNNIEQMDGEVIEKLLQVKLKKINVLVFVHNITENVDNVNNYYTRIMFYDTCQNNFKKHFKNKKYHYFVNKYWDMYRQNVKSIDDIFSVFSLNEKTFSLKFSFIQNSPNN